MYYRQRICGRVMGLRSDLGQGMRGKGKKEVASEAFCVRATYSWHLVRKRIAAMRRPQVQFQVDDSKILKQGQINTMVLTICSIKQPINYVTKLKHTCTQSWF